MLDQRFSLLAFVLFGMVFFKAVAILSNEQNGVFVRINVRVEGGTMNNLDSDDDNDSSHARDLLRGKTPAELHSLEVWVPLLFSF